MPRWRRGGPLALAVALGLAIAGCGRDGSGGSPAPDFELERVGGGLLRLEDLRGKLVLVDFWATWCAPCVKALPELNALYLAYRDRGVEVVGLAVDDLEAEELSAWLEERDVQYPVARASSDLAASYGAYQFPQHVLISPEGTILEQLEPGYHTRDELEALLARHQDARPGT